MGKWNAFPGDTFFDTILNKSCILQWENVAEFFLSPATDGSSNRWLLLECAVPIKQNKLLLHLHPSFLLFSSLFFLFFCLILPMFLSLFYHCYRDKLKAR